MEYVPIMSLYERHLDLPLDKHLLLFGARNTGKSTLIKQMFSTAQTLWIDLLDLDTEERYLRDPSLLKAEVMALDESKPYVVIDEVQKIPRLLDVVHQLIESTNKTFIVTGSCARKLQRGGANLLAGRAFVYYLYPLTSLELGDDFELETALRFGTLPAIQRFKSDDEKIRFLQAYSQSYLREEIWVEQFIRKLEPFRRFLEFSAQSNGEIINFKGMSRDVGVDDKTIKQYYSILEDTLIGFFLEAYQHSFRKRLSQKPKFYYFDTGVARALSRMLSVPLTPSTHAYGNAFEHFVIVECLRLANYYCPEYRFSYLRTKDGAEIDLVAERPGKKILLIKIKGSKNVSKDDLNTFSQLVNDFGECEAICLSNDKNTKKYEAFTVYPWQVGIQKYFVVK
jgi:uncharacterized protein